MPFNSYEFIFLFLPLVVTGFWLSVTSTAGRDRGVYWLILASAVFYLYASWVGFVILIPSILLDYWIASLLLRLPADKGQARSRLFMAGIVANLALLAYFKYKNFFLGTVNALFSTQFDLTAIVLPLGISFLTFQKIAFLVDVKSGSIERVRFKDYLLFTTLFPRTIAGPIIRYNEVVSQFYTIESKHCTTHLSVGIALFSMGFFKKAFVADQLSQYVAPIFDLGLGPVGVWDPGTPTLIESWRATLAYTLQLYFDFSGYSDMALGVARMVGIQMPMNFNSPLKASSIVEFWSRWHITLTRFLTAYIYTPLVMSITRSRLAKGKGLLKGNRSSASAIVTLVAVPTITTMVISGFWHGAGWQFILWGGLHGTYLAINQIWRLLLPVSVKKSPSYARVMRPAGLLLTLLSVIVALVFFRARSVTYGLHVLYAMLGGNGLFPDDVAGLYQAGIAVPPLMVYLLVPVAPWIWILVLFLWVTLLPNSLEILEALRPAVDYPDKATAVTEAQFRTSGVSLRAKLIGVLLPGDGHLSPVAGVLAAVLCVLGTLMLTRGAIFIYWNF